MNNTNTNTALNAFASLFGTVVWWFLDSAFVAFVLRYTYNSIAYEFNLPQFGFMVCFGFIIVLRSLLRDTRPSTNPKKREK